MAKKAKKKSRVKDKRIWIETPATATTIDHGNINSAGTVTHEGPSDLIRRALRGVVYRIEGGNGLTSDELASGRPQMRVDVAQHLMRALTELSRLP